MITGVMPEELDLVWPSVEKEISRVTKRFDLGFDSDHVFKQLKEKSMQLWLCNGDAVAVTELLAMPDFKVLGVPIIAGKNMRQWLPSLVDILKAYGKHHNCKYVEGYGRKGWERMLEADGFKPYSITTRCVL